MKYILFLLKAGCAGIVSLYILSAISLVYEYTGVHVENSTGATDYKWESNQLKSTMEEGFSWIHMDDDGFNNAYEPKKDQVDILLMGSSHMEAVQVGEDENVGFLLNEALEEYTYNIGTSGHTIYRCVNNIENAVAVYNPSEYVIVETDRVDLSWEEMQAVLNAELEPIPSYDSGLMYWFQKNVPAVKSIFKQLEAWNGSEQMLEQPDAEELSNVMEYKEVLDRFLSKAVEPVSKRDARLIIFYQPETNIDSEGNFVFDTNEKSKQMFAVSCEENDIIFIDMSKSFEKLYEKEHILAHGFSNTSVGKGHLNRFGHKAVAETLVALIKERNHVTQ